jgi:signal transduction histidine kinase
VTGTQAEPRAAAGVAAAAVVLLALAASGGYAAWWLSTPADCAVLPPVAGVWRADGVRPELRGPCAALRAGDLVVPLPEGGYDVLRAGPGPAQVRLTVTETVGAPRPAEALAAGWSALVFVAGLATLAGYAFARGRHDPAVPALLVLAGALLGSTVVTVLGLPASAVGTGWQWLYLLEVQVVYTLAWSALLLFALRFPAPEPVPGRRGRAAAAYLGPQAVLAVAAVLVPGPPGSTGWVGAMIVVQSAITVALLAGALAISVRRFRRAGADPVVRQQLRWMAAGWWTASGLVLAGWFVPALLTGAPLLPASWLGLPGLAGVAALAVALLRFRLFDLDAVLRRTILYVSLSVLVVALYLGVVAALAATLPGPAASGPVAVAGALAVALAVNPLRLLLQRALHRTLYGDRDDPYAVLGRLGSRLATTAAEVLPAAAAEIAAALRVPFVGIDLLRDGATRRVAAAGAEPEHPERWSEPLVHRGEVLGALVVAPREPGERPGPAERRLLTGLAAQLAPAAQVLALDRDLHRSRERLVLAREEERRALRRALHDEIGPAVAALALRAETARRLLTADAAEPGAGGGQAVAELTGLRRDATAAAGTLRRLAYDLRPPSLDELGLAGALREQADRLAPLAVDVTVPAGPGLPAAVEVAAYRIAVEAMANAARHAGGRRCAVRGEVDGRSLRLEIVDDGCGWPAGFRSGVGITAIRERVHELGGTCELGPAPGGGARVAVALPLREGP